MTPITKFAAIAIMLCSTALAGPATLPKANEYKSGDCSGAINLGHHSGFLRQVSMNDDTHSVYLNGAGQDWIGFTGKTSDGLACTGESVGKLPGPGCLNLDTYHAGKRVRCVFLGGVFTP